MTKLKGTILLGEGYNKTKAIFNGNIDNLEVKSVSIKDSTANDILLGNGTTLPLFNGSNTINSQYLPSYVDDVIEAPSQNDFPTIGELGKIYLDISTNSTYRWGGSTYVLITSGDIEQDINNAVTELQKDIDSNTENIDTIKTEITDIQNTLAADKFKEYDKEYLTFTALEDSSIGYEMPMWASEDELPILDLQYSYDGITWTNFDGTTLSITAGNFVKFKGDNTEFHRNIGTFIINGKVDASGNVMSIVYADNFIGKIDFPNDEFNLSNLFGYYCSGLYSAHNLILPALNLTYQCYYEMFTECTSLISTPELPATTLLEECYCGMFSACTSLTTAPLLPSLKLAPYCYSGMFYNCNSLVSTPELPATTLATSCYSGMFNKCSSLVNAPSLPAIILANSCYEEMFYECTALLSTPELPATILADKCYNMMFYGCTSLTNICELPAKKLENSCYQGMFGMCTSLTEIPELHAKTLVYNCYTGMFLGCDNVTYAKMLCDMPSTDELTWACSGMFSAPSGTIVLSSVAQSHPDIVPRGWKVINYYVNNEYISELKDKINSSNKTIQSNTEEIDILKNRIISTTYSKLKDAVTNSTLTTGQYYRITDYVTTCNGTSAKVTDVSTIDPANPVDGQSRSAGHQFDIIVRALSPNQLDENAVAVCNASETYYDSTFNGTIIKYSIENKYWSTEDGKGTIYYMKDHNDNECSYDFTNIEYYYAEDTTWYLTFNKDSSKVVILNTNTVLPFVIIYGHGKLPNSISITGSLLEIYMYAGAINAVNIKGTITNFKVIAPTNKMTHTININGNCDTVLLLSLGLISTITLNGYNNNIAINVAGDLTFCTFDGQHQNLDVKVLGANAYCGVFNLVGQSKNCSINVPTGAINCFFVRGYLWETVINAAVLNTLIDGTLSSSNIIASELNKVNFNGLCDIVTINSSKGITNSNFDTVKNIEITGGTLTISQLTFMKNTLAIKLLPYNGLTPSYIIFEPRVFNITIEGGALNITLTNVARNLHLKSSQESAIAADVTIHGIRGVSAESLLEIPLDLIVKGGCKKDIYSDLSGRIFYTCENNLVKKGYYINDNTDTEWKEIPTPEEPVEVPTIPDVVTTALSVATLDLTTRTTIATIATDETLAFTLVPAIQGEYRLVVVNSSEADITITMPTEENYQCLCGATLTIPAQTNIELIINVTDTLIYIRKG